MKRGASIALLLLLTVCGCGSNGSGSDGGHASAPGAASGTTTAAGASDGRNPVDGGQFCAFLAQSEPKLKSIGTPVGAEADFAIGLANWIGEHPDNKPRTAADLDDASQQSCPKARTAVLADLGAGSFQDALG